MSAVFFANACGVHLTPLHPPGDGPSQNAVEASADDTKWKNANNLSQSIFHVGSDMSNPAKLNFDLSYYDLDHLNDEGVPYLSYVTLSVNFPDGKLTTEKPAFTSSTITCNSPCTEGDLNVVYHINNEHSRLYGSAKIHFSRNSLTHIVPSYTGKESKTKLEQDFVKSFQHSAFLSASLTRFSVADGLVNPWVIEIHERDAESVEDVLYFSNDNLSAQQKIWLSYARELPSDEAVEAAQPLTNFSIDGTGKVTLQFLDTLTTLKDLTLY